MGILVGCVCTYASMVCVYVFVFVCVCVVCAFVCGYVCVGIFGKGMVDH